MTTIVVMRGLPRFLRQLEAIWDLVGCTPKWSRGKWGGHMTYDADECTQALPVVDALKRASLRESLACEARASI